MGDFDIPLIRPGTPGLAVRRQLNGDSRQGDVQGRRRPGTTEQRLNMEVARLKAEKEGLETMWRSIASWEQPRGPGLFAPQHGNVNESFRQFLQDYRLFLKNR